MTSHDEEINNEVMYYNILKDVKYLKDLVNNYWLEKCVSC